MSFVSALDEVICEKWRLSSSAGYCILEEDAKQSRSNPIKIGGCRNIGFTLDRDHVKPWGFIKDNPPAGFARKCDGIVALEYDKKNYLLVVELKSSSPRGAELQLRQGLYLFDWIARNLEACGRWSGAYEKIGIVCFPARKSAMVKRTTSRFIPEPRSSKCGGFKVFELRNLTVINIKSLLDAIS